LGQKLVFEQTEFNLMATDRLYYAQPYATRFEAEIVDIGEDGTVIALDRSLFYPVAGGQPADNGKIAIEGEEYQVTDAYATDGWVWHKLDRALPSEFKGKGIQGEVDWERRWTHMRHHSGLHLICGIAFSEFGALVSGAQIYGDRARVDLTLEDLSQERVSFLERAANSAIEQKLTVQPLLVTPDEAAGMPELVRTLSAMPPQSAKMRVMEIVGLDRQFCGGTHVSNTEEIGALKIIGTRSKGKNNKRIEISVGE
jgi:misacylated tRNA(Ala) deacylase